MQTNFIGAKKGRVLFNIFCQSLG